MKCEECLPLLEEFADGEVDRRTSESMSAHMAACTECAEAFDALSAEQEMYLRYDRELEVPPSLWHGVRERIAEAPTERVTKPLPLLSRLRGQLAIVLGALALRPALASSLALLVVGVAAGVLWLAQAPSPVREETIAQLTPIKNIESPLRGEAYPVPTRDRSADVEGERTQTIASKATDGQVASPGQTANLVKASATATRRPINPGGAGDVLPSENHPEAQDDVLLSAQPALLDDDVLSINTRLLDPEEKEVARHVEHAQMLLRSFRNARDTEGEGVVNIVYEKSQSRKLLDENTSLQLEAEAAGNKTTARILNSLEPFLLDISNLRDEPSRDEVRSIKDRMQKKEIIASLQVY
ncbi:MAG: hypothetical protein H0T60_01060 [Acidobacteria bacterium]|nr:hypothetical protein [Acidobacteriota bacterium]